MASEHPQFDYWRRVLAFGASLPPVLNISYLQSLTKIIPWMFTLDHYNYARWLTVHVNDLISLENNSPLKYAEFLSGSKADLTHITPWIVSGPETARLLMKYDSKHSLKRKDTAHHHEQIPSVQKSFIIHIKNMTDNIQELDDVPVLIFSHLILTK